MGLRDVVGGGPLGFEGMALPFLSVLAPSERYAAERGRREMVAAADRAYASLKLLDRCRGLSNPITFVARLRMDAALYEPARHDAPAR